MSHDIQRIDTNPRLSGCVLHNGLVYVSGQVPTNLDADAKQQTLEVLAKLMLYWNNLVVIKAVF